MSEVNAYLKEFEAFDPTQWGLGFRAGILASIAKTKLRNELVTKYAWALPNEEAIEALVDAGPIIELGAGTGYWAELITAAGGDIYPYDEVPVGIVQQGGPEKVLEHPDRVLFLCWPPRNNSMASDCLRNYTGDRLYYLGDDGCCGDGLFWDDIYESWEQSHEVTIPRWPGMTDTLRIYDKTDDN